MDMKFNTKIKHNILLNSWGGTVINWQLILQWNLLIEAEPAY